jgi:hypothetical protein
MGILEMQGVIQGLGWQWQELVFNDGSANNCMIEFTQDKSPHALSEYPRPKDRLGWGRFPREKAWQMAYDYIVLKIQN